MEDELNFSLMEDDLNFWKLEDDFSDSFQVDCDFKSIISKLYLSSLQLDLSLAQLSPSLFILFLYYAVVVEF